MGDAVDKLGALALHKLKMRAISSAVGVVAVCAALWVARFAFAKTALVLVAVAPVSASVGELAYFDLSPGAVARVELPPGRHVVDWGHGKTVDVDAPRGGGHIVLPSPTGCAVRFAPTLAARGAAGPVAAARPDEKHAPMPLALEVKGPGAAAVVDDGAVWGVVGCDRVNDPPAALWTEAIK